MIGALVRGYWYDAASTLLDRTLDGELSGHSCGSETVTPNKSALLHAHQLAAAARRVLDLDAEDFASIATGFQSPYTTYLDRFHSRLGSVNLDTTAISDRPEAGECVPIRAGSYGTCRWSVVVILMPEPGWPCPTSTLPSWRCATMLRSAISSEFRRQRRYLRRGVRPGIS